MAKRAVECMPNGGSIIGMTYYGSEKAIPGYNVMGVAKAALEACTRYLAMELGEKGVRVNTISAGPIKTLSAAGIKGLRRMLAAVAEQSPLRRNVDIEEIRHSRKPTHYRARHPGSKQAGPHCPARNTAVGAISARCHVRQSCS